MNREAESHLALKAIIGDRGKGNAHAELPTPQDEQTKSQKAQESRGNRIKGTSSLLRLIDFIDLGLNFLSFLDFAFFNSSFPRSQKFFFPSGISRIFVDTEKGLSHRFLLGLGQTSSARTGRGIGQDAIADDVRLDFTRFTNGGKHVGKLQVIALLSGGCHGGALPCCHIPRKLRKNLSLDTAEEHDANQEDSRNCSKSRGREVKGW